MIEIPQQTVEWFVLSILFISAVVLLIYTFYFYLPLRKVYLHTDESENNSSEGVSIVIACRSEKSNLEELLPLLFDQNYPMFEVVIVDDASWDGTPDFLEEWQKKEKRLKTVSVKEEMKKISPGKKLALTLGIKAATFEKILLTDADCRPNSPDWIRHMVSSGNAETEIVLGYSPYVKSKTFTNLVVQMETTFTAIQYLSFALRGKTYMAVGRNLMYTKKLFFSVKGFASHHHLISGDDDLFIRDAATTSNVAISVIPEAWSVSIPKETFGDWFRQKKRHFYIGKYYKAGSKWLLAGITISHWLFWVCTIVGLFMPGIRLLVLIWLGVYGIIRWTAIGMLFSTFKQTRYVWWLPLFEVLYVFYTTVFMFVTLLSRQKKW